MPDASHALVIIKGNINPPVMSVAASLAAAGRRVTLAASAIDDKTQRYLSSRGVGAHQLQPSTPQPRQVWNKLAYWWDFRNKAWELLKQHADAGLLWIGSADTALAMGRGLWRRNYVLQLHELYDTVPFYRKHLREYARQAQAVVVPEANRAAIFRSWYGLARTPFVLPNKPLEHPRQRRMPVSDAAARRLLETLPPGVQTVMYQGIIHAERDLRPVGRAVAALGDRWRFVVVGADEGFLAPLRRAVPDLLHIPFVPPPYHLEVTSHAAVGVLAYCFDNLNNVYCAPNKIWEYSGFGLPMLGNDVPGLKLVEEHGAGLCVDFQNEGDIATALERLAAQREQFAAASARLYDSFDLSAIVREIAEAVAA